jgi:hypothetical protein
MASGKQMNRRGIELQFNWIFILIAGALILAFFFSVVQKQRALSEEKLSITLSSQMDAIFTGAIESRGTEQILPTPKPGIAFSCSDVCECNYMIGKTPTEFGGMLMFAPPLIKGQDTIAWTIDWKLPYRVANFLLLTNPNVKYYLVYDANNQLSLQLFKKVTKAIPAGLNMEKVSTPSSVSGVSPGGYEHTRFVFLGTENPLAYIQNLNPDFQSKEVSGVWIDDKLDSVVFFEKSDPDLLEFNQPVMPLAGEETAYASIFASDHLMYKCMMRRAFDKLGAVSMVHAERAKSLKAEMESADPPRLDCVGSYDLIVTDLNNVAGWAKALSASFPEAEAGTGAGALSNVLGARSGLQQQNQNLLLQNCPEIY